MYNRRYMFETCRREFSRATRTGQSVSVLSMDIVHFKKSDDNHGHDAGDSVLRAVADCLKANFRDEDVPCRFGGEEFAVILPGTVAHVAVNKADEVRAKIEARACAMSMQPAATSPSRSASPHSRIPAITPRQS